MSSERPDRAAGLIVHYLGGDHRDLVKLIHFVRGVVRVEPIKGARLLVVFEADLRTGKDEFGDAVMRSVKAFRNVREVEWVEAEFSGDVPGAFEINEQIRKLAEKIAEPENGIPDYIGQRKDGANIAFTADGRFCAELRTRTRVANFLRENGHKWAWDRKD